MARYDHEAVEKKWQEVWEKERPFRAPDNDKSHEKFYILDMFPYPSAEGLHVGHPKGYTATDIITRYRRMKGQNVLHPIGFDAFGLPAENYAIKTGIHPAVVTKRNIDNIRRQIKSLGFAYDWDREISTTDPAYYRWTQWIFLKMFEKSLAYETFAPINFCTRCKTGLANEEVKAGLCVRCGAEVVRKDLRQWALRITAYADRLLGGLDDLDWPESIKTMQREWIGRSTGADVLFPIHEPPPGAEKEIEIFTTRPDTLFGATYMVLAPEHPLTSVLTKPEKRAQVEAYVEEARRKSDLLRTDLQKDKTGVWTGSYCINPLTGSKIPVWVADYVLMGYGTGAIMAVPAHDQRDYEFAVKFGLEIIQVVRPPDGMPCPEGRAYVDEGVAMNSGSFDGLSTAEFMDAVTRHLEEKKTGRGRVRYKLRDWIFSRQRYWGEPIPVVHCEGPSRSPARGGALRAHGNGRVAAGQHPGLGRHALPAMRGQGETGDQHHAPVGRVLLVLPQVPGPAKRRESRGSGQGKVLDARGPVRGRLGARGAAPSLRQVLAHVSARHRRGVHGRALCKAA
jgi:leucyl-tRNA synthetase